MAGASARLGVRPQRFDPEKAIRLPDGTIPPLVDRATWDAVQAVLQRNKAQSIRSAKNPEAALLAWRICPLRHVWSRNEVSSTQ